MSLMILSELGETIGYGILSSRVSQALISISQHGNIPTEEDIEILQGGVELIDKFIKGSRLVEGDKFRNDELLPSADNLTVFRYAVTTLRTLKRLKDSDATSSKVLKFIQEKLTTIVKVQDGETVNQADLKSLAEFFTALASLLCDDITKMRLENKSTPSLMTFNFRNHEKLAVTTY